MSDIDDRGPMLAKRVQKGDPAAGFSEVDHPSDGPPDCKGSPVEHYLNKHGISGMESVLSGSEEDIHLQSVNIFFERLKNLTDADKHAEPNQVRDGKTREAIQEKEPCTDEQQASMSTFPTNIPKLNSFPANSHAAVGKRTMKPVDTIRKINTIEKVTPGFNISPEPGASSSKLKTNKSAYPETELFVKEEAFSETRVKTATPGNQFHDSLLHCSETAPHADKMVEVEIGTYLGDIKQEDKLSQLTLSRKCSGDLSSNLEMGTNVNWKEQQNPKIMQSSTSTINETRSQELSPSVSIKRKRRKKRRLSAEPFESGHVYERQALGKQWTQDSEEEQNTWRGGTDLCLSKDINLSYSPEPQKNVMSSLYSVTSNHPVRNSAEEIKVNEFSHSVPPCGSQYPHLSESIVKQGRYRTASMAENKVTHNSHSVAMLSTTDVTLTSPSHSSGKVQTDLQPCMKLDIEEVSRLNKCPCLPLSLTASLNGKSDKLDMARETPKSERKDTLLGSLQQSNKANHPIIDCENEQNGKFCTAEVKSITACTLPNAESNDPVVDFSQNDKLSAAKSVLAVKTGNYGRDSHVLCQRELESQQQLEIDSQDTDQYNSTLGKTHLSLTATGMNSQNADPQQFKTRAGTFLDEVSSKKSARLTSGSINSLSKSPSNLDVNNTIQETEHSLEVQTLSKTDNLTAKNITVVKAQLEPSQMMAFHSGNPCKSIEINLTGCSHSMSMSEDLLTCPSPDITPVSSCCTLDTGSVMSLSNENMTDISGSFCSPNGQNEPEGNGEKTTVILSKHEEEDDAFVPKNQTISSDLPESKCELLGGAEDVIVASKAECEPKTALDSKPSLFTMSSFWSEMEKLTINDILGLRMLNHSASPSPLIPIQENDETDMFAMTDSGFFTQLDEPKQTNEYMLSVPESVQSSLASVMALDSFSSRSVMWENEPVSGNRGADIYPGNMMLTAVNDISQPVLSESAQKGFRKISKNVSVHNLHALESESSSSTSKDQSLPSLNKKELETEYFPNEHMPKEDNNVESLPCSLLDSYQTSFLDAVQYLFGGKQSIPRQPSTDDITTISIEGESVPETYDHFFSEFDTESFFSSLVTEEVQTKDELVPIFSCSRSANKNFQFPEAYDFFFASSSSDDSSVESDEDDNREPMKVVTRFSRKKSASQINTDMYENFFTDNDLGQNFFWKATFSFRNTNVTSSTVQKQTVSNSLALVPVKQSGRAFQRTLSSRNILGNQDILFPDPLLCNLEDRISRQLAQQPFRNEDLQTAVSNPSLDPSLLPLRQSDMCLVCIAFASWVLKTANPQVGDAWKAVLLANVSALSAIRYLRKYVKRETAATEKKLHHSAF
ncbi:uncharacterized protein perm1a isoform X2 [Mastacembelus armatus]|nr:PGC-1 and ERR-induced regulator in muscle protein 1 isoform X2 [Mastacembelus armatus]XP_026188250.1 PGC-1 and ERR-induced regulator in muscle protein 1 isoform X2 [Mastacembelus armatus]